MSILTTLALVVIPLVKPKKRNALEVELEKQLKAAQAERDLWRNECLVVRQRLTEAVLENVNLGRQLASEQRAGWVWTEIVCTPSRADVLNGGAICHPY